MIGRRGMGEYPGYYCYDANRPSWLPYWIDDFAESACKWNPATIAGNLTQCIIGSPSCPTGFTTPLNPYPSTPVVADPTVSGGGTDPANQCPIFTSYNPQTGQCEFSLTSNTSLLYLAAGAGVLLLLLRR